MSVYLYNLARWAFRHRRLVLASWLLIAMAAIVVSVVGGGKTNDHFTIPGTESQQVSDLLSAKIPAVSGGQTQVVFATTTQDITQARYQASIRAALASIGKVDQVSSVTNPFTSHQVSDDKHVALAIVQFSASPPDVKNANLDDIRDAVRSTQHLGVDVEYTGSVYPGWRTDISELPELIGLIVAFIILLVSFGVLAAAGMPILNAIIGVVITITGLTALASLIDVASAATTVALMLGLSCGIDYGLFVLSRHRANLLCGMDPELSVGQAVGTAGSSVVFAALTVIVALCGLSVVGIPFLTTMGLAAAGSVFIALLIALTLLPALIGFSGTRLTKFSRLVGRRRADRMAHRIVEHPERAAGARWAALVVRFRIPVLVGGVALLGILALPTLRIELGLPSGANKPASDTSRKAYDLTTSAFGAGFNGALTVVVEKAKTSAQVGTVAASLIKLPDVLQATPVALTNGVGVIQVIPRSGPNAKATSRLVHSIRSERVSIEGSSGTRVLVGGTTASNIDVSSKLASALPTFLIVVVGLAFVMLTFAFRTILVPIKSIIGFLLSVGAAFGSQVAIFQWGWGRHLLGITPGETISFLPILMLAIIFGLSSDYEVFVVSRIKEDFTQTHDARGAVVRGTALSARVVSAAVLIMFFIFVSFMITKDPTTKVIGFSFAVGVFLDAFVVRLTLVPAVSAILGARLWYHPRWFDRHVPDPDIEGNRLKGRIRTASTTGGGGPQPAVLHSVTGRR